ncbi:MAG: 6,7-dimethyl-8-ribityllumazine synthase [Phycisphaeraceae bacterium]|nr:6,7-dimethyl-8-ribityllumazine synthase [Phycisphaeraceae bacterium]
MSHQIEGDWLARGAQIAIVVSRFNDFMTRQLVDGAVDTYTRLDGNPDALTIVYVPGAFELPITALKLAQTRKYAAVICLGCVIRGATDHYDFVAGEAARGIAQVGLQTGVPTIFGVITAENMEQAIERCGSKQGNHGSKAMFAALEMANVWKKL